MLRALGNIVVLLARALGTPLRAKPGLLVWLALLAPFAARGQGSDPGWRFSLGAGLGFENGGVGIRGEVAKEHLGVSLGFGFPAGGVLGLRGYLGEGSGIFFGGEVGWAGTPILTLAVGAGYRAQWEHLFLEAGLGIASTRNFPEPQYKDRLTLPNVILGAGWRF